MFIINAIIGFFNDLGTQIWETMIDQNRWLMLVSGLGNTALIAFFALIIGVVIGTLVAVVKVMSATKPKSGLLKFFNFICDIYINIIRGTPVVVQLLIMYFVIFVSVTNGIVIAIITFGLNSGAYVAEIMRAGIMAVDRGQTEAGRSLGLSGTLTMWEIVLPQAIKNILPALANEFITLLKETSVAGYVAIQDLTKAGDRIRFSTYSAFIPLITVALIYLVIVLGLTWLFGLLEKKLRKSDSR